MSDYPTDRAAPSLRHPVLDESPTLRAKAHALGLSCPDMLFLGWRHAHRFCCSLGHEFHLTPSAVVRALKRCPRCEEDERFAMLQARCAQSGLQLLRLDASVGGHRYRLRCSQGHVWSAGRVVVRCPMCTLATSDEDKAKVKVKRTPQKVKGIERLRAIAEERGGRCLSDEYLGYVGRHRFKCAEGHEWEASAGDVIRGHWCGVCASDARFQRKYGPAVLQAIQHAVASRGGVLLTKEPIALDKPLQLRCAHRHKWSATSSMILRGAWCEKCHRGAERLKIAQAIATHFGGRCLSQDATNVMRPLFWVCGKAGHVWRAQLNAVRRGLWCLDCAKEDKGNGRLPRLGGPLPFLFYDEPGVADLSG